MLARGAKPACFGARWLSSSTALPSVIPRLGSRHQIWSRFWQSPGRAKVIRSWSSTKAREAVPGSSTEQEPSAESGSIQIFIGPMFAGKTSALLHEIQKCEASNKQVITVKSDKDSRYGLAHLHTHDGKSRTCFALARLSDLHDRWPQDYADCQVIAIDEAQFFPDLLQFCTTAANEHHKHVVVAGLDGDFKRQKFGQVLDLIPQADAVIKLTSNCTYCEADGAQSRALFSLRIAAGDRQNLIGGADKYAPVCRAHYEALSRIRPAAKEISAAPAIASPLTQ